MPNYLTFLFFLILFSLPENIFAQLQRGKDVAVFFAKPAGW